MVETALSKVGNSMAVILPKTLREEACITSGDPLLVESPRKGVVVITAIEDGSDRIQRLRKAQERIAARSDKAMPWPDGKTADDLLMEAKRKRLDGILSD